ncbi:MAG TPA: M20/M25/M40 family metallo-hydrolase, partial [Pirellulales bacterium]|nr:M20/M25/M40 family metallo-hydrolase [Pirellulales bacterium]
GIAAAHRLGARLDYRRGYPPVINAATAVAHSVEAAESVVGRDNVRTGFNPSMGCEDFAYMIKAAGGAYTWIGTGEVGPGKGLHGDRYDFNDDIVPIVLRYWVDLVEQSLLATSDQTTI